MSVAGAVLFGAVGLPLMVLVQWLWSEHIWPSEGLSALIPALLTAVAAGVCFGYLAGLGWGFPDGLVFPAIGTGVGLLLPLVGGRGLGYRDLEGFGTGWAIAAILGVVAYPLGLLAWWLLRERGHVWLGLAWGGVLIVLGLAGLVIPPPAPDEDFIDLGAFLAPLNLAAGIGTLAIVTWSLVRSDRQTS